MTTSSRSASLARFCAEKLAALDARAQRRVAVPTRRLPGMRVERLIDGALRTLVDFSSNDSLGLAHHPAVRAAAHAALEDDGAAAGGSRLVSGSHPRLHALEERIAPLVGCARALVTGSGWLANVGVLPALVDAEDVVVIDALAHASLQAAARLSRARVDVVAHNDVEAFARALRSARGAGARRAVVVTDSVFSMDGDRAPLAALRALCDAHDAWLLVDDAHGFLVSPDRPPPGAFADVVTGTLSKACGSYGGFVAGPADLVDLLLTRARPVLFGTALPPAVVAAASAAIDVACDAGPAWRARPQALATRLCAVLDLPAPQSHVVPIVVGDEREALALMHGLQDDGLLVVAIRPPTVPAGTSRLRVALSAGHDDDDVTALAGALSRRWRR